MAYSDILYLIVGGFALIIVVLAADFVFDSVVPQITPDIPVNNSNSINNAWSNTTNFFDNSFGAIWFLLALISLALAFALSSHPIFLIAWLLMNLVFLWVYDTLSDTLDSLLTSDLNTGAMDNAHSFLDTFGARSIVILNIFMAIALFGKKAAGI